MLVGAQNKINKERKIHESTYHCKGLLKRDISSKNGLYIDTPARSFP